MLLAMFNVVRYAQCLTVGKPLEETINIAFKLHQGVVCQKSIQHDIQDVQ